LKLWWLSHHQDSSNQKWQLVVTRRATGQLLPVTEDMYHIFGYIGIDLPPVASEFSMQHDMLSLRGSHFNRSLQNISTKELQNQPSKSASCVPHSLRSVARLQQIEIRLH
jgi:hypothetical protein